MTENKAPASTSETANARPEHRPDQATRLGVGFSFYDEGWNARCRGEPYHTSASLAWRDGWKDCDGVRPDERTLQS